MSPKSPGSSSPGIGLSLIAACNSNFDRLKNLGYTSIRLMFENLKYFLSAINSNAVGNVYIKVNLRDYREFKKLKKKDL